MHVDAIIVGGGPAGLNAALVLARCRRSVVLFDAGRPRNYAARHLHNFLSRDGIHPQLLLNLARRDLRRYDVPIHSEAISAARCSSAGFIVRTASGRRLTSRTLLLATGVVDELPPLMNLPAFYGQGVHHCPYCDGWEYRARPLAAYGAGRAAVGLALNLLTWSPSVTVLTNGSPLDPASRRRAGRFNIACRIEPIAALLTTRGRPAPTRRDPFGQVSFASGPPLPVDALFFNTDKIQRSRLPLRLGCRLDDAGGILHDRRQRTGVPGLFVAGDASFDVQFVIVAAAEGAKAAVAMNHFMQTQDRESISPSTTEAPRVVVRQAAGSAATRRAVTVTSKPAARSRPTAPQSRS